jgi:hypothetical protein
VVEDSLQMVLRGCREQAYISYRGTNNEVNTVHGASPSFL